MTKKRNKTIKVFEGFAGYGGASFGLKRSGIKYKVIGFSEVDPSANRILHENFPEIQNYGDILTINEELSKNPKYIPDFDMFTGGFPCQPFSTAGKQMGEHDVLGRGRMLGEILKLCKTKKPHYILLENVRGFKADKFKHLWDEFRHEIGDEYAFDMAVLNTKDYGIPQNRERLWIFGIRGELPSTFSMIPPSIDGADRPRLKEFLDAKPSKELYLSDEQVAHFVEVHNRHREESFNVSEPLCFDVYNHKIKDNGLCNTLTEPSHNITRIVEPRTKDGKLHIRKLSVTEQFRLMGFEDDEIRFPNDLDYRQISARAGNGWDVNLVGRLLKHIFAQL